VRPAWTPARAAVRLTAVEVLIPLLSTTMYRPVASRPPFGAAGASGTTGSGAATGGATGGAAARRRAWGVWQGPRRARRGLGRGLGSGFERWRRLRAGGRVRGERRARFRRARRSNKGQDDQRGEQGGGGPATHGHSVGTGFGGARRGRQPRTALDLSVPCLATHANGPIVRGPCRRPVLTALDPYGLCVATPIRRLGRQIAARISVSASVTFTRMFERIVSNLVQTALRPWRSTSAEP
jgi:hypothetical protein